MRRHLRDPVTSEECEAEHVKFTYDDQDYRVSTFVTHNLVEEDVGIGWYEYWGHMENDTRIWLTSELNQAEFGELHISLDKDNTPIVNPDEGLIKAAEEAAFHDTYEKAEERANNV